jgi:hypothetical protein
MAAIDQHDRQTTVNHLAKFATAWRERINAWREEDRKGTETKHAQQFWSDLLRSFGIIPERIDLFERDADRASTRNRGRIDFFMSGVAIGEAKSLGVDLDAASRQIDDYLAGGGIKQSEWPRFSLLTDFEQLRIRRLDGSEPELRITIDEIADHYDHLKFLVGLETVSAQEQEEASVVAAQLLADLYTSILGDDADEAVGDETPLTEDEEDEKQRATSILMTRLLFLLYGDDAALWEADLFYRWVQEETTPTSLGGQLQQLFQILNTPENRRPKHLSDLMARFPYVNGAIFADSMPAEFFTPETHEALLSACRFKWTRISVSILGSMFQLVKSKEARRAAGEHYTSEKNILKTLGPLFLDEYEARAAKLIANKSTKISDIDAFLKEMGSNVYCDPACGAGNFLNVAYARLRAIETSLLVEKRRRNKNDSMTASFDATIDQVLSIEQFFGFEIGWWPAKIAETAMFLVDHQANLALRAAIGEVPERLPITMTAHIIHGNALELEWTEVIPEPEGQTFIFGNPPFIGQHTKTTTQTADMKRVWAKDYDGYLDYVTGWHAQALSYFKNRRGEFGFVTTNSITQGQPVPALFGPIFREGWRIKYAHRTFAWNSEAPGQAAVHCVVVGFTRDRGVKQRLWDYASPSAEAVEVQVKTGINAYLADGPNILVTKRSKPLSPLLPVARFGSKPVDGGNLVIETAEYEAVMADPVAAKYVRPFRMGKELVRGLDRWCLWLVDLEPSDLSKSPTLRERLQKVAAMRAASAKAATRELAV